MNHDVTIIGGPAPLELGDVRQRLAPLLEAAGAERAVVFGSWARGSADAFSDLDLVVVLDTDRPFLERGSLLPELFEALPMAVDLLIYTPAEFREGMLRGRGIFNMLATEGVTIHGG